MYVPGSISDGGVWANSDFAQALEANEVDLPPPIPLPGSNGVPFPHFFVGDEAFPLRPYIMRPYPGRMNRNLLDEQTIYNYRLSRARRVIENTFGILVARRSVLNGSLSCCVRNVEKIVKCLLCLHNLLMDASQGSYIDDGLIDVE